MGGGGGGVAIASLGGHRVASPEGRPSYRGPQGGRHEGAREGQCRPYKHTHMDICTYTGIVLRTCLTTVIAAPALGRRVASCQPSHTASWSPESADEFRLANFCRRAADVRATCPQLEAHFQMKTKTMPQGQARRPKGHPKWIQGDPNESRMESNGSQCKWSPKPSKLTQKVAK